MRHAAALLRCAHKQLWRRIDFYVDQARAQETFYAVQIVGFDETSLRRGQNSITVVYNLDAKRQPFHTEDRDRLTVLEFADDLKAQGGTLDLVRRDYIEVSTAYANGLSIALPNAAIS